MLSQFWRRFAMHFAEWVRSFSTLPFVTKWGSKRNTKMRNFNFHLDSQINHLLLMHSAGIRINLFIISLATNWLASWRNSSHLPIAQNRGVKRNTFWKIYTFFKKWEQDSYCELRSSSPLYRTKWGSKRKCFLKISQKFFWSAKLPEANASRIRSRRKIWHYWQL